ncbi:hypothetical protein LSH36_161g14013 [Paralvinella palmiformis]|uniref:Uncharacterized protein n=1 Tax=Paralvinella palmiformis TaxID=53620 RepID=A0AAD9JTA5_9ANNE|nr:hypothetical protein LSH36_161g14013 [Paralvinella palmiformis]
MSNIGLCAHTKDCKTLHRAD